MNKIDKTTPEASGLKRWQDEFETGRKRDALFTTVSSAVVPPMVTQHDLKDWDPEEQLAYPGQFPFTRGVHPSMYRGRLWTMRMFSGFATPEATNQRFKFLLEKGQTGLSVAFDLPTLMGRDSDDPWAEGEVGKCGVSVCSLRDMEVLFDGIEMEKVSTSMTINSPAAILWSFYIAAAEKQGADRRKLRGTIQNDILKEFIAQKEYIFPPKPSMRLQVDTIEFGTNELPEWNTISISGYHIREAGSTAVQELAFTLSDGFAYVEAAIERGLEVDAFAPRLSHFFNAHLDFFEEIAKYRAARRIWAKRMRYKYGAKNPRSWLMRFHTQTAGCSLTAQQPENNIVRTAIQALAGVLGGTQSLHTNSMDETLALPSAKAAKIALRTQQVIASETGVANVIDPLGGSYYVEQLTDRMEAEAEEYFERIDELGGVIPALEQGFQQREISRAAYRHQLELESKGRIVVGINDYIDEEEVIEIPLLKITSEDSERQVNNLKEVQKKRNPNDVKRTLDRLNEAARSDENLMPHFIECAHAYVTLGEMINVLRDVFGEYREAAFF
ncbi:MAG: methylmalonyl-CoA mutase family protein [Candidatus Hatepunaea meridiana]|nr:methylmalonyl-CoA mutase family protein [Candidatus Hatepunaea meridiana]